MTIPPSPSIKQLAARTWDAIVVGAGHNGLTCAAYLARAGRRVLVLESRNRIGGACTLEETWPGYRVSPCAYVCGLLHPLVIEELELVRRGLEWHPAMPGLFVPFEDGSSVQLWGDDERLEAEIRRFAPKDLVGWRAMSALKARVRDALRPPGPADLWIGPAPSREAIESRLGHDPEAIGLLFEWSMVEFVERYLSDERLQRSLLGQGVIGTNASPHEPGTASIHFHHASGRMGGMPGMWGYIKGGMGMVSFILADVAREVGVQVTTETPVSRILPGEGVELEGGERLQAPVVVSNADPRTTLRLLGDAADRGWRAQVEQIPMTGCTVKITVALRELPNFLARPGTLEPHHFGQVNTPLSKAEWRAHYQAAQAGELPPRLWTELYFQSSHDPSVTPDGQHIMSIFAQPVPYRFSTRKLGQPAGGRCSGGAGIDRPVLQQHSGGCVATGGHGSAGHRAADRAYRRAHFPGRVSAGLHVGPATDAGHADDRRFSLRSRDLPGRERNRDQWPQRRHGDTAPEAQLFARIIVSLNPSGSWAVKL